MSISAKSLKTASRNKKGAQYADLFLDVWERMDSNSSNMLSNDVESNHSKQRPHWEVSISDADSVQTEDQECCKNINLH
jgi:hypothetical protein